MITKFKIYEGEYYTEEDIDRFKKNIPIFIKFITGFISTFGFDFINMNSNPNEYLIMFYMNGSSKGTFKIGAIEEDETISFYSFEKSDNLLVSAIPDYLKTVNGIKFNKKVEDECEFYIYGDVYEVIEHIDEEKLMLFASSKKFNL